MCEMINLWVAVKTLNLGTHTSVLVAGRSLPLRLHLLVSGVGPGLFAATLQGAKTLGPFTRRDSHRLLVRISLSQLGDRMSWTNLRLLLSL